MRRIFLISLVLMLLPTIAGATTGSDYQAWFESFLKRFQDCSFTLSDRDKDDLQNLMKIKPAVGTGKYYDLWFVKGFCWFIEDCGILLDQEKAAKLDYMMSAEPDLEGSGQHYAQYLRYIVKRIENSMPVLDNTKKTYLQYFKKAMPQTIDSDYQVWLQDYNRLREKYGPVFSADENLILQFLSEIRPISGGGENTVLQVKRDRLLRIRTLILNKQPEVAVGEIDQILSGH